MTVSMGLAMVAAGLMAVSVAELRRSRGEFAKTKVEYALDEAQARAVIGILQNGVAGRLSWEVETASGQAKVLAEPEYPKASLAVAAQSDDKLLERFGVQDPDELKARLTQTPPNAGDQAWIAELDPAPLWRACAPSLISRYGQGDALTVAAPSPPNSQGFSWRPGEVWRVKATLQGWGDDRIVRLTGDDRAPAVTIERRFSRPQREDDQCDAVFAKST